MTTNRTLPVIRNVRNVRGSLSAALYQRGQALVEAVVSLIVLVPLAAGITVLGQYLHIQQQARAAARDAAWSATTAPRLLSNALPGKEAVQTRLRARHFAAADAALRSGAVAPSTFDDPMLLTFAGSALVKPENLRVAAYGEKDAEDFVVKSPVALPLPNAKGLVTAEVSLQTEKLVGRDGQPLTFLDPLDKTPLTFRAKTVLLADTWDAAGAGETAKGKKMSGASKRTVRKQVQRIAPLSAVFEKLKPVSDVGKLLGAIPLVGKLLFPGFGNYRPGRTAPDVVPADRLVKYKDVR